jgi:hypothetical protein
VDALQAYAELAPFLRDAADGALTTLADLVQALDRRDPEALELIRARVALGEGYGWNLYQRATAWDDDRLDAEILEEAADLVVYHALRNRLLNLPPAS